MTIQTQRNSFVTPIVGGAAPSLPTQIAPPPQRRVDLQQMPDVINIPAKSMQPGIDYVNQGLGFLIKYAALFIVMLILSVGLAMKMEQGFGFWVFLFGLMTMCGYWSLAFMENVFEPTSGHVVKSFFGALVIRWDIASTERITMKYYETEQMRLDNEHEALLLTKQNTQRLIDSKSKPQAQLNNLANYRPEPDDGDAAGTAEAWSKLEFAEIEPVALPTGKRGNGAKAEVVDDITAEVMEIICGFTFAIYESLKTESPMVNPKGFFGTRSPLSDRAVDVEGNEVSPKTAKRIREVMRQMPAPVFVYNDDKRAWRLDLDKYPDYDSALLALEQAYVLK